MESRTRIIFDETFVRDATDIQITEGNKVVVTNLNPDTELSLLMLNVPTPAEGKRYRVTVIEEDQVV